MIKAAVTRKQEALLAAIVAVRLIVSRVQMACLMEAMVGEEGEYFRGVVLDLAERFRNMPKVYEQDGLGEEAIVHLHYFLGGSDWWITERDSSREQLQAFGLARLGQCPECAELGYIPIVELIRLGVELDLHFEPRSIASIKKEW